MFPTAHLRVATRRRGSAARTHRPATRIVATATALALGGAFALVAPLSASAADVPTSYAEGRFLSGDLLGLDLDAVVSLGSASASNNGAQPTQTSKDPLDATVLDNGVVVHREDAPQADLGGVLQVGPVAQYAEASPDGSSLGASGAIKDDGAIGFGEDRSTPPADATVDLAALLGPEFASTLLDLKLELGAIAAQARADLDTASGDYQIAYAVLTFSSPALAGLTPKVDSALAEVSDALDRLVGPGGGLVTDVNGLLVDLDPVLNLLGGEGQVSATIRTGDLAGLVHTLLKDEYGDDAVSFDLEDGTVRVDLAELLGGDLNDLAPGTELLSDEVVDRILDGIVTTVATIADQVVDRVDEALHDATVDIHADLSVDVAQAPLVQQICRLVDRVVTTPVLRDLTLTERLALQVAAGVGSLADIDLLVQLGLVGSLDDGVVDGVGDIVAVNGILQKITGFVTQAVQDDVCGTTSTPVLPLTTSVVLDIEATVDELLDGAAARAVAEVEVLGIPAQLDLGLVLDDLGDTLVDGLFDGDGGVQNLADALDGTLVEPTTQALLGDEVGSIGDALRDVVSVQANVQELASTPNGGGEFTQTALRVGVLGDELATLSLGQATVGPNVTAIVDPECTDPDGCDVGGETVTPPGSGGGGAGSLAYTGIAIATLLAVILALLAAGAYLVREGHRRTHSATTTE